MGDFKVSNLLLASRIKSFDDPEWPHGSHYGYALADAGFFYLGTGDKVQCCKCDLELELCDPKKDDPIEEHRKFGANCELKFQQKVDNCFRPPQDQPCTLRYILIGRDYDNKIAVEKNFLEQMKKRDVVIPEKVKEIEDKIKVLKGIRDRKVQEQRDLEEEAERERDWAHINSLIYNKSFAIPSSFPNLALVSSGISKDEIKLRLR